MLERLALRDFVIVTSLEVEFTAGFSVLTGETGAGKSILIDALQLVLGGRADAGVVREGSTRAEIAAEFSGLPTVAQEWLDHNGFTAEGLLLLRRTVDSQGRSRAWINGSSATQTQLRELGEWLLDIHGQHAWQSLTRPAAVRALLDDHAGLDTAALSRHWSRWQAAHHRLDEARRLGDARETERERLAWQIAELDRLAPGDQEWPELNAEHQRLAHAQSILDAVQRAVDCLSEAEVSASGLTAQALEALGQVAGFDPSLRSALDVLQAAQAHLDDAAHSLHAASRRTELDPDRLAEVDSRLSAWVGLARRFRRPPEELPQTLATWREELRALDAATDLDALRREAEAARQTFLEEARQISAQRRRAAPTWSRRITEAMQILGMAGGRFDIQLTALDEPQAWGMESVEFCVAGHAGSSPKPLGKVASGGELSRIALAIAVTDTLRSQATQRGAGTLIFDEVDAGIGGAVAHTVGRLMRQLGRQHQVLAVTHLAQVAACADRHLVVSKATESGRTRSEVRPVQDQARVMEVARMLGGHADSKASLAHAREMLESVDNGLIDGRAPAEAGGTPASSRPMGVHAPQ